MYPVLFTVAGVQFHTWGIFVTLGILAGVWLTIRLAKGSEFSADKIQEFIIYGVVVGFLGARAWEVLFSLGDYVNEPWRAFMLWQGGLSIQGAVAANVIFSWWFFHREKLSYLKFADIAVPGLILGQAIGRIGCFFNGDAYGKPTDDWYGVIYKSGTSAFSAWGATPLVPAELMEAGLDIAILAVLLLVFKKRKFDGQVGLTYFVLYTLIRFGLEFLRTDSLMVGNFKAAQITALATAFIASFIWLWKMNKVR